MADQEKRSGPSSATELMSRLANDPDYQRMMRAQDAERQVRTDMLTRAEQPIVADLRRAGIAVDSVWDLVNTSVPYPGALPVLLEHLQRGGYPDWVMASLGRALAVKPANAFWDTLRELYLKAEGPDEEEGLAVALAASATAQQLDALIDLLGQETKGESRTHFLRTIKRVGGTRGREVLESLTADPVFGGEARARLKRRRPPRRPDREPDRERYP